MEVVITDSADVAASFAADIIEQLVTTTATPVVGLATGSSPLPVYREVTRRFADRRLSFASTTVFLLDEYVGLPPLHPQSYRRFIEREFTDHVDLPADRLHCPDGASSDLAGAAIDYERSIAEAGGIGVQLLGIGADGHIGFNEPSSSLGSRTRIKSLTARTRRDNARFFHDDVEQVPRHCITQGIATILAARHLVLLAFGPAKAGPLAAAVEGPITAMVPASALQLHPHVTVLVDEAAAAQLTNADYYRETFANKPEWQSF